MSRNMDLELTTSQLVEFLKWNQGAALVSFSDVPFQLVCIKMSPSEYRSFIETAVSESHGDTYNLISKNCNHVTDDISWRLTSKHIPGWVNRLALHETFAIRCCDQMLSRGLLWCFEICYGKWCEGM